VTFQAHTLKGWRFAEPNETEPGENVTPDPLHINVKHMSDLYFRADPAYPGRYTVPVIWDKKTNAIVNNESSEIIRMLYTEFDDLLPEKYRNVDLYPESLKADIDKTNQWTYDEINNGV
jgi:glutathionyl-hydroquinone reductase